MVQGQDASPRRTPVQALAHEWRTVRDEALEAVASLQETRASRNTDRPGWTLKHELAHFAALDAEVTLLVDATRRSGAERVALRRLRGQAMLAAQEMRLTPLREHLAEAGEQAAHAIEAAGEALEDAPEEDLLEAVRERLERARAGVAVIRQTLGQ